MQRRNILKAGVAGSVIAGAPMVLRAQQAYKAEYKMSTVVGPAFAWGKGAEIFANIVRERTGGRINIKQYPGSSLVQGQQDREFSAMRQGIIDILVGAPVNWSGTVKECGMWALPFLFPDHKAYDAATIASEVMTKDFFDVIRKAGAEPLAVGETGYRQLSNSKRPVLKPDDMKGLKVRIVASPMYNEIMSGMGANPTAMSWADAQPALASGAVDGQENPLEVFLAAKINTLGQKFVTKWNYSNDILLFAIANPIWLGVVGGRPEDRARGRAGGRPPADQDGARAFRDRRAEGQRAGRAGARAHAGRDGTVADRLPPPLRALEGKYQPDDDRQGRSRGGRLAQGLTH
jgi:TRAP-type C4-dicarboxylate transport system substrate-binding protein